MKVVIAEKPSVAREIAAVLGATTKEDGCLSGNGYKVTWAFGHLIGLANAKTYGWEKWDKQNLPMIPEQFRTEPVADDVKKQLKILSKLFKEAELIINGCDAGREGELIFRYIYEYLAGCDGIRTPFSRLWISSLTDKAIREGFNQVKPGSEYDNVADAAKARSEADWLVGINATVATTLNVGHGTGVWSVGRVQTPTLAMICRRFIANRDFKPTPYFTLQVLADKAGKRFKANNAKQYPDKGEADRILARIAASKQITVSKVETKPLKQNPPLLYDLTTLQKEANSRFSFSADKTLEIAQKLYEKKLTTYPRTGSRYIPDNVFEQLPALIANAEAYPLFTQAATALRGATLARTSVNAAKVTDHHALLPTEKKPTANDLAGLSKDEVRIYEMIVGRMLETVSAPCLKDVTTVVLTVPGCEDVPFTAKGYIVRQAGWRGVMNLQEEKKDDDDEEADLPPLTQGEELELVSATVLSKQTKAPALLTENTLLGKMEVAGKELENEEEREAMKDVGLGTPATRAAIIENLIAKGYVARSKKNLVPTEKGLALYEVVKDMKIANAEVTGNWEKKLNLICDGKMPVADFNGEIISYTHEITSELLNTSINTANIQIPGQTKCPCPKCKAQNVRFSPKGFAYCPDKACGFIISTTAFGKKLDERTVIKLITTGSTQKVIKGLQSKSGKKFECVLKLSPEFKVALDLPDQGAAEPFACTCPKCKAEGTLQLNNARLWCTQCALTVWRERSGHVLSPEELKALCTEGTTPVIEGFKSKAGKTFTASVKFDKDWKAEFVFPERETEALPQYTCPKCHGTGTLTTSGKIIGCSTEGCGFKLWRSAYGHELTEAELQVILAGGKTEVIEGLSTSKDKPPFSARLGLTEAFELKSFHDGDSGYAATPLPNTCPKCRQQGLSRSGKKISCTCGFSLWAEIGGILLEQADIDAVLARKKTRLFKNLVGKQGKKFDASFRLNDDCTRLEYVFPPKNK